MIIDSAQIQLSSNRTYSKEHSKSESLRVWGGRQQPVEQRGEGNPRGNGGLNIESLTAMVDSVEIGLQSMASAATSDVLADSMGEVDEDDVAVGSELHLFKMILEKVLHQKVDIKKVDALGAEGGPQVPVAGERSRGGGRPQGPARQGGFGLAYDYHESYHEEEATSFAAEGVVRTKDGKEINFQLALDMNREYHREDSVSIRLGQEQEKVDPLVINFDGDTVALTDAKFEFDLDSDGDQESISFLKSNSGFLAFDRNGDGVINNGSELFGPSSGNGFAELAAYDQDGNNFIDEGDEIYNKLSVYNKNAEGEDQLTSLRDTGVGAIYLNNVSTEFSLNDTNNEQDGQVRTSSIYLEEDGGVGTVQQVDLSV